MLPEMWSSMRRWFLGSLTAEKNEQNVANPRQKDHSVLEASAGEKQENGPTPAKKTTMLILMAPPKDLQQVLLAILDKKKGGKQGESSFWNVSVGVGFLLSLSNAFTILYKNLNLMKLNVSDYWKLHMKSFYKFQSCSDRSMVLEVSWIPLGNILLGCGSEVNILRMSSFDDVSYFTSAYLAG